MTDWPPGMTVVKVGPADIKPVEVFTDPDVICRCGGNRWGRLREVDSPGDMICFRCMKCGLRRQSNMSKQRRAS